MSEDDKGFIQKAAEAAGNIMGNLKAAKDDEHVADIAPVDFNDPKNMRDPDNSADKKSEANRECSCDLKKVRPISEFMHVRQTSPSLEYFCCNDDRECIAKMNTTLAASRPKQDDDQSQSS